MENTEVIKRGTWVRHSDGIGEGEVRGDVAPNRVGPNCGRCVWVFWSWGRTIEKVSDLEVIE